MKYSQLIFLLSFLSSFQAWSASGNLYGLNVATGLPYLSQAGFNFVHSSKKVSFEVGYRSVNVVILDVNVALKKPEVSARWHPFSGSFFLGLGLGQQDLSASSDSTISGQSIEAQVSIKSTVITPHLGWMWGAGDGGFFGGLDFGYQLPSNPKTTLSTNADSIIQATPDYQDLYEAVNDQGKILGQIGIPTVTLLKIGYLF